MRRLFTIAAVVLAAGSVIFARSGMQAPGQEPEAEKAAVSDDDWDILERIFSKKR